ncbi:hypothetical protein FOPG_05341 [Fusarium oxysporum f. sp. conglutinans race 2 54008]|uniref:Uncharacterized protein n=1 Tax=Fusarium oxysporum f. sp. conglutinans race 2 54008 TaxID=1089457 RepID=X0HXT7_FUSOX|nr:hypothetical protein FOPG_05341 [Fusarium oxysporum f. sp. conglutinans race 2 54008]
MELACGCSLGQYLAMFATPGSISDLVDIRRNLRQRSRQRGATSYQASLEQFRSQFMTRLRISDKDLIDRNDVVHQKGLIEMAHEYLCVCENGSLYWPSTSDDGSLRYSRDQYEIYTNIVWFFLRRNLKDIGKRLRSTRSRTTTAANNGRRSRNPLNILGSESPTPSPPDHDSPNYAAAANEDGDSSSSSESPQSSQTPRQDEAMNNRRPIPYGRAYSPDELAEEGINESLQPIPDAQPRRVSRMQDLQDNLRHIGPDPRPNMGVDHRERGNNPSAHTTSTGTQTGFETDEYRDRDPNAPPPSSMNSNNASQQSQQAYHNNNQPRPRRPRDSIEYGQRSPSPPYGVPRSPSPEPKPNIDLIFSYDVLPGLNLRLAHGEEIFSFPREQVFRLLGWQHDFDWLLISLETPGALFPERIARDDNREFRKVMARFEQIACAMKRDYAEIGRDAVIEVAFVPECKGHSRTVLQDGWRKRLEESRGIVL